MHMLDLDVKGGEQALHLADVDCGHHKHGLYTYSIFAKFPHFLLFTSMVGKEEDQQGQSSQTDTDLGLQGTI